MNKEEITEILNRGKDLILNQLIADGFISRDIGQKLAKEYYLACIKPSEVSKVWEEMSMRANINKYVITKIIDVPDLESEIKEKVIDWESEIVISSLERYY